MSRDATGIVFTEGGDVATFGNDVETGNLGAFFVRISIFTITLTILCLRFATINGKCGKFLAVIPNFPVFQHAATLKTLRDPK